MTLFFLRTCDAGGHVLHNSCIEATDRYGALAQANLTMGELIESGRRAVRGHIDIADGLGRTVARLRCDDMVTAYGTADRDDEDQIPAMPAAYSPMLS
ncbi:MAG TPA: hypothetical protein VF695_09295 [Sphingomonas sp.]|jgi:hypothetical protein